MSSKNFVDFKLRMREKLIASGLEGMSQSDIIAQCRTYNRKTNAEGFTGQDVRNVLYNWRIKGLVQQFKIRKGYAKKPTNIWRATKSLLADI